MIQYHNSDFADLKNRAARLTRRGSKVFEVSYLGDDLFRLESNKVPIVAEGDYFEVRDYLIEEERATEPRFRYPGAA